MTIREQDRKLADALLAGAAYDSDTKRVVPGEKAYIENLPEGVDAAAVKAIRDYDQSFIAAAGIATGEMAVDQMAANKDLDAVSASFDMTHSASIDWVVQRSTTNRHPKTGVEITRLGAMSPTYVFGASKGKTAALTRVRDAITDLANMKFGESK